jgi:hypothetical protein
MGETCRRLLEELRRNPDRHRLLEIETIIRLLVPHLTRAVADVVHAGHTEQLGEARSALLRMRDHLSWVQSNQKATPADTQTQLIDAVGCASAVLDALERL